MVYFLHLGSFSVGFHVGKWHNRPIEGFGWSGEPRWPAPWGYEKDQYWAGCRASCEAGAVNPTDPIVPWGEFWSLQTLKFMYRIFMHTWMVNVYDKCRWNIPTGWWILKAYGCRCWFPLIWACQYCWSRSHPMNHLLGSGFKHVLFATLPVEIGMKLAWFLNV